MKNGFVSELIIRRAAPGDLPAIKEILTGTALPVAGVDDHIAHFLVSESRGEVIGTIGLEVYGETGLLRSAAVVPAFQNKGVGGKMYNMIVDYAREIGITELVLLTTTAEKYFGRKGFVPAKRDEITVTVQQSEEFKGACPSTATAMKKKL